ncbi:hypothetical protein L6164_028656 [Bauhinia variegata]|uniref:Uncharacterized protein n=1 Tax=Bauhinia variegata TaxID=167791 RepID=A0ACB9L6U6_BAUVA|nr:hypothetical protein L6164_028656 [Bauhinia variegata]
MKLSSLTQTNIGLPFITATADGPKHIETTLTRAKFEELCSDLLDRDAKLSFKDIDEMKWWSPLVLQFRLEIFRLDGIPPAPRGVPQIEVKFDIDANGILSLTAVDKGTGKKQDITITGTSTLPKDEIKRMVKEVEKFASEDKEKSDAIDAKNQAEKHLKELGDKGAMAALNQEVMQLGQSLYNQPGAAGAGEAGPSKSSGKGPDG